MRKHKTEQIFVCSFCVQELKSEIVRSTEDEVAARHGVGSHACPCGWCDTDGLVALICEIDALEVDLEVLRDMIVHAEIERQVAGIRKARCAAPVT